MKKTIMAVLASLTFASTAFAAVPGMEVTAGQTQLGYSYNYLQTDIAGLGDLGDFHANTFTGAHGISDKVALTGDYLNSQSKSFYYNGYNSLDDLNYNISEVGLQYKVTKNLALAVGNVKSEVSGRDNNVSLTASNSEMYGGIAYNAPIGDKVDGYASYLRSSNVEDGKVGLNYLMNKNTSVDLGYRYINNEGLGIKSQGTAIGVNYKF